MSYSFRVRVNRCQRDSIETEESSISIPTPSVDQNITLQLKSTGEDALKESEQYVLLGSGYESEEQANADGISYQNALMIALAASRIGADFGSRAAKGAFTDQGLKWVGEQFNVNALNNTHGLMVYESDSQPRFVSMNASGTRGVNRDSFVDNLLKAIGSRAELSEREQLAFTLYNSSFFQPTSDSRFILLVMAVEALIEPEERSADSLELVDSLIVQTKASDLEESQKNSILGSLNWLRKESINQAGKRLAKGRLGGKIEYANQTPSAFFSKCYQLRSNLVHGNTPYPTFEEVGSVVATLEVFVADMLTEPFLGK